MTSAVLKSRLFKTKKKLKKIRCLAFGDRDSLRVNVVINHFKICNYAKLVALVVTVTQPRSTADITIQFKRQT